MDPDDGLAKLSFRSAAEWEGWLTDNHARSEGIWIKIAKKDSGIESVRYPEVLDSAICFGWIDGQRQALDEGRFLQRFTPRRKRSRWSQINRDTYDLLSELNARPKAKEFFEGLNSQNRYAILYRLDEAKRPETRSRRLAKFIAMLEAGESIHGSS